MDMKDLKKLVEMIAATDFNEFEYENGDDKVCIRRGQEKEVITVAAPMASAPAPAVAPVAAPAVAAPAIAEPETAVAGDTINSPMVGSFYRRPSPDAEPFVEVGSVVEAGQGLCIVEAMKLFNEIEAEFKCRILEILKEDSQPVEFGEPLFRVERL